jgi:hypothetical protein
MECACPDRLHAVAGRGYLRILRRRCRAELEWLPVGGDPPAVPLLTAAHKMPRFAFTMKQAT